MLILLNCDHSKSLLTYCSSTPLIHVVFDIPGNLEKSFNWSRSRSGLTCTKIENVHCRSNFLDLD